MVHEQHKRTIRELKRRILHAEQGKQKIVDYAEVLREEYETHKISKKEYLHLYHKGINGKSIDEWLTYYDDYIRHCKTKIHNKKRSIGKRNSAFIGLCLVLFSLLAFIAFQADPTFIGYTVSDSGGGDSGGGSSSGGGGDSGGGSSSSSGGSSGSSGGSSGGDSGGSSGSSSSGSSGSSSGDSGGGSSSGDSGGSSSSGGESSSGDSSDSGDSSSSDSGSSSDSSSGDSSSSDSDSGGESSSESSESESDDSSSSDSSIEDSESSTEESDSNTEDSDSSEGSETEQIESEDTQEEETDSEESTTENEENAEEETSSGGGGGSSSGGSSSDPNPAIEENKTTEEETNTTEEANETTETNITNTTETNQTDTTIQLNLTDVLTENETFTNDTLTTEKNETVRETNNTNITEEANITTVQYKAVLGKPVKWKKRIDLETAGSTSIELPKEAEGITVKKAEEELEEITIATEGTSDTVINSSLEEETIIVLDKESPEETQEQNIIDKANFTITGKVITDGGSATIASESKIARWFKIFFNRLFSSFTGRVVQDLGVEESQEQEVEGTQEVQEVTINDTAESYEVEYETPAPYAIESETRKGKTVEIIGPEDIHYEQVLSFTEFSEDFNITDTSKVRIYWVEGNTHLSPTLVEDLDGNGVYDYVEWITPHLSNQTIEIILISAAEHLDENKTFIADIYNETSAVDDVWVTINDSQWVRVTFEKNLTSINDITLYARSNNSNATVEVYHYNTSTNKLATFSTISNESYYKIYLTNMTGSHDTFDLKILEGIDIDLIIDPTIIEIEYDGWPKNYTSALNDTDHAEDVVTDSNDNVYVVGWGYNLTSEDHGWNIDTEEDWWIKKFWPNGTEITDGWDKKINNVLYNDSDKALGVAVDSSDNVYVVGYTNNTTVIGGGGYGGYDWWIKQFNSTGTENSTWAYQFDGKNGAGAGGSFDDVAWSVAVDSNDTVYVVGYGTGLQGPSGTDGWAKKFWKNGTESTNGWDKKMEGGNNGGDAFMDVAIDSDDNVTIVGYAFDGRNPGAGWGEDAWRVKYEPGGNVIGGGTSPCLSSEGECVNYYNMDDRFHAIKYRDNDHFYAAGYATNPTSGRDWLVRGFRPNNTANASFTYFPQIAGAQEANEIIVDGDGDVFTVGYTTQSGQNAFSVKWHWQENATIIDEINYTVNTSSEAEGVWKASTNDIYAVGWGTNLSNYSVPSGSQEDWWLRLYSGTDVTGPAVKFIPNTPSAGSHNESYIGINVSIVERNLENITYHWNGTNYTLFNNSFIALFNFDDRQDILDGGGSGQLLYDSSLSDNNGTLNVALGSLYHFNQTGRFGKAKLFNATDNIMYIDNETEDTNNLSAFSVSFWYYLKSFQNLTHPNRFIQKVNNTGGQGYILSANVSDKTITFSDSCGLTKKTNTDVINLTGWHHLTLTVSNGCDASGVSIYHDGREVGYQTSTGSGNLADNTNNELFLGGSATGEVMNGSMDEFMMWNRSLSNNEVDQLYMTSIVQLGREKYYYYTMQYENATDVGLANDNYTVRVFASDKSAITGKTEDRTYEIDIDQTPSNITFIGPTFANGTKTAATYFTYNVSVNETNLARILIQKDGVNGTAFDNTTMLAYYNFDNIASLGENSTHSYDITGKHNNASCSSVNDCPTITAANGGFRPLGNARSFNGTQWMQIDNASTALYDFGVNTSISMEAWIKTNHSLGAPMRVVGLQDSRGRGAYLQVESASNLRAVVNTTSNQEVCYMFTLGISPTSIKDDQWHHVAMTYNPQGSIVTYLDGTVLSSDSVNCYLGNLSLTNEEWYIGKDDDAAGGLGGEAFFNGSITEVVIYNTTINETGFNGRNETGILKLIAPDLWIADINLTSQINGTHTIEGFAEDTRGNFNSTGERQVQIGADVAAPWVSFEDPTPTDSSTVTYNYSNINVSLSDKNLSTVLLDFNGTNITFFDGRLLAYYNFDNLTSLGESNSKIVDVTDYQHNITNVSGAVSNSTEVRFGEGVYTFGGDGDYLAITDNPNIEPGNGNFSVSAWVYVQVQPDATTDGIITKKRSYGLLYDGGQRCPVFEVWTQASHFSTTPSGQCIGASETGWFHFAGSYDGTNIRAFINGAQIGFQAGVEGDLNDSITNTLIGLDAQTMNTNTAFKGHIDEVKIWNRSLNSTEIKEIYQSATLRKNSTHWHAIYNRTNNSDGPYTYEVFAADRDNNLNSTGQRSITISQGSSPPSVFFVEAISAQDPVESGLRNITFSINVSDSAGVGDLNLGTLNASFSRNSEPVRFNDSCQWTTNYTSQNTATFGCTIRMQYYDEAGTWDINVSIKDLNSDIGINSTETFTYNLLHSMIVNTTNITFPVISPVSTDIGSSNDPVTITNTGNDENLTVNVTGFNLLGWDVPTDIIYAGNFTVGTTSEGCSGNSLANNTQQVITGAEVDRGSGTAGQENLYFCIKEVPETLSAQVYNSTAYGAWIIATDTS